MSAVAPTEGEEEQSESSSEELKKLAREFDLRSEQHAIGAESVDDERLKASFMGKSDGFAVAANHARRLAMEGPADA